MADEPDDLAPRLDATTYETKTRGTRQRPATRVVAGGDYALVRRGRDSHLRLALDITCEERLAEQLNLPETGRYVLTVKNPLARTPDETGLPREQRPEYPENLQDSFDGNRWTAAEPTALLDHDGAEILLVGADVPG